MKKRITDAGKIIGKYLLLLTVWIISIVIADALTKPINALGKPLSVFFFELIPWMGLVAGHILMIRIVDKTDLSFIRIGKDGLARKIVTGFGIGSGWLLMSVIPIYYLGAGQWNNNWTLTGVQLFVYFLILVLNAGMQELLVHGYLFALLQKHYSRVTALLLTSLLFLLLHPGAINSGTIASINVFGAGLIFGLITIRFNSLLAATMAHAVWNYFGAVWLGLIPLDIYPSMKWITVSGDPLWVGDKNGMETSLVVSFTAVTLILALALKTDRNKPEQKVQLQVP